MGTTTGGELLRERDAAELLGVTPRFLQERRVDGRGPRFIRVSARAIRYRREDLDAWIRGRVHSSTAEYNDCGP